jgi:hypothetical protein
MALAVEQQEQVKAGGHEMPVVGALLLLPVYWNLGRVQVQHDAWRRLGGFRLANKFAVDAGQADEVLLLGQHLGL